MHGNNPDLYRCKKKCMMQAHLIILMRSVCSQPQMQIKKNKRRNTKMPKMGLNRTPIFEWV